MKCFLKAIVQTLYFMSKDTSPKDKNENGTNKSKNFRRRTSGHSRKEGPCPRPISSSIALTVPVEPASSVKNEEVQRECVQNEDVPREETITEADEKATSISRSRNEKGKYGEGEERSKMREEKNILPHSVNHTKSITPSTPILPPDQVPQALNHISRPVDEENPSAPTIPETIPRLIVKSNTLRFSIARKPLPVHAEGIYDSHGRRIPAVELVMGSDENAESEEKEDDTPPTSDPGQKSIEVESKEGGSCMILIVVFGGDVGSGTKLQKMVRKWLNIDMIM